RFPDHKEEKLVIPTTTERVVASNASLTPRGRKRAGGECNEPNGERRAASGERRGEASSWHRAFAVQATLGTPPFAWRILVDASTGEELARSQVSSEASAPGLAYELDPGETPRAPKPLAGLYVFQGGNQVTTDASGNHSLAGTVTLDQALSGPLA